MYMDLNLYFDKVLLYGKKIEHIDFFSFYML